MLLTIIIVICAIVGLVWAYPRLPYPGNLILVVIVALICLFILLNVAGVETGLDLG